MTIMRDLKLVPTLPKDCESFDVQPREAPNAPSSAGPWIACGGIVRPYLVLRLVETSKLAAEPVLPEDK
jgi:hypothetical protein